MRQASNTKKTAHQNPIEPETILQTAENLVIQSMTYLAPTIHLDTNLNQNYCSAPTHAHYFCRYTYNLSSKDKLFLATLKLTAELSKLCTPCPF